jgi:hypothetical protein
LIAVFGKSRWPTWLAAACIGSMRLPSLHVTSLPARVAAVAVGALLAGAVATPASAADRYDAVRDGKTPLVKFWFWDAGDKVQIRNYSRGGWEVEVVLLAYDVRGRTIGEASCSAPAKYLAMNTKPCDFDFGAAKSISYWLYQFNTRGDIGALKQGNVPITRG